MSAKAANTTNFVWNGPVQGVELLNVDSEKKAVVFEAMLLPGKTYAMPVDHPTVVAWKTSGLVRETKPLEEPKAIANPKTATKPKKEA